MPKEPENTTAQKDAIKKVSPYRREDAPCTLFLTEKLLSRRNGDGTLNQKIQTVSTKWWNGTLKCQSGTERPDIWVVKADAEEGVETLREVKSIKYMLFSMKDRCKCNGYHTLSKIVNQAEPREPQEPEAESAPYRVTRSVIHGVDHQETPDSIPEEMGRVKYKTCSV